MEKDWTIEISRVANGYILRTGMSGWFNDDRNINTWAEAKTNFYVFQTFYELTLFLEAHFTHRQKVVAIDS